MASVKKEEESTRPAEDTSSSRVTSIPIASLGIQQLNELQQNLDQDMAIRAQEISRLRGGAERFQSSEITIKEMKSHKDGDDILVPVTGSLYMKSQCANTGKVYIDIGAGYHLEKSIDKAVQYCQKRCNIIHERLSMLSKEQRDRKKTLALIKGAINLKVNEALANNAKRIGNDGA